LNQIKEGNNNLAHVNPEHLSSNDRKESSLFFHPVLIGTQLAKNHHISPGDELILVSQAVDGSIGNAIFIVNGVFKAVDPVFDRTGVLMSVQAYQELMYLDWGFHELLVRTPDINNLEDSQRKITQAISKLNEQAPLDALGGVVVVRNWKEISKAVADMLEMSKSMIWILGFIIVALSSLGVLNTVLMAIHERSKEFGILLAIGMKGRWLLFMILMESLYLGLLASISGSFLGVLIIYWFREGIDYSRFLPDGFDFGGIIFEPVLELYLEYDYIWMISLLLILVTMLAGLVPSLRTIKLKPAEVM
jgi:ABC-type lipoprotein release transport system permease subunit